MMMMMMMMMMKKKKEHSSIQRSAIAADSVEAAPCATAAAAVLLALKKHSGFSFLPQLYFFLLKIVHQEETEQSSLSLSLCLLTLFFSFFFVCSCFLHICPLEALSFTCIEVTSLESRIALAWHGSLSRSLTEICLSPHRFGIEIKLHE